MDYRKRMLTHQTTCSPRRLIAHLGIASMRGCKPLIDSFDFIRGIKAENPAADKAFIQAAFKRCL
jgi:hypothetical protein